MPRITIDYIPRADADPIPLLPEKIRAQMHAAIHTAESIKENDGMADAEWEAVSAANLTALRSDDHLRESHAKDIRRAVFEYRRPTLADKVQLQQELAGITDPGHRIAVSFATAHRLLEPKAVSGWEGPVPLVIEEQIAKACADAFFPSITEEQALFTLGSPGSSASAAAG